MRRVLRACAAAGIALMPMLLAGPARADDPATLLTCPSSLGGLPLVKQEGLAIDPAHSDDYFGAHGYFFECEYRQDNLPKIGDADLSAGVLWEEADVASEAFYCRSAPSWNDVGSNGEFIGSVSPDKRATSLANQWTDSGGSHGIPIQPAVDLAAQMLPLAEARASSCTAGADAGSSPGEGVPGAVASTSNAGGQQEAPTGDSNGAGVPLVVGGAVTSVIAGAGSLLAGPGRGSRSAGGGQAPAAEDVLLSGEDSISLLHGAGMLEPVTDASGAVIGYQPLGDLQRFIESTPQWQPAFQAPVPTPGGGTATHLAGVAFQTAPDGTITSISVAVRPGGPAPSRVTPSPRSPEPAPGIPLADRLAAAQIRAIMTGVSLESMLNPDPAPAPAPDPAPAPAPSPPGLSAADRFALEALKNGIVGP